MVFQTRSLLAKIKKPIRKYLLQGFRDSLKIQAIGGKGGNGYPKFGGVGGQGGNVVVVAKENITLQHVFRGNKSNNYQANHGRHSTHNFILGTPGGDLRFDVPVGVTIFTDNDKKLGELNEENDELVIAKGGEGGNRKNGFIGRAGQTKQILFDLKLIADIGLVGFPNAGKSTLLKAISHAKPKIASYPFTTIRPNIGIISYKDLRQISMADLPGLIEGAYANKGMGHKFLKHVERTKLLLLIVDINGFQLSPEYPFRSCMDTVLLLNKELEMYNPDLLDKPSMILINKMDSEGAQEKYNAIKNDLHNLPGIIENYPIEMRSTKLLKFGEIIPISAKSSLKDINKVKMKLRRLLDIYAEQEKNNENLEEDNAKLYTNLQENLKEKGPRLV